MPSLRRADRTTEKGEIVLPVEGAKEPQDIKIK